jgi:protease-4
MADAAPRRRRRWLWVPLLLAAMLLPLCTPLCVVALLAGGKAPGIVPPVTVLELDLEEAVADAPAGGALLSPETPLTVRDVVFALEHAATDPRVRGLFVRVGGAGHGLATAQEIRDAVVAFRASGKPTLAWSESFGELSPGTGGWYVATAFDDVWLQPAGVVSLTPLSGETPFARDALGKLGVQPQFAARKEFKNAPNSYTEQGFTAAHREATTRLLSSAQQTLVARVAASRPALGDAAAVTALLAGGPYDAEEAVQKKLVDRLGYRDEAVARIKERAGPNARLLWLSRYHARAGTAYDDDGDATRPLVAVVTAVGQIHRGTSNDDPLSGTHTAGSDTVGAALRQAIDDDDVRAIVLRIDSPGGSVVASETIAHEVERATKAGKPVIASMANVAGSGGYYIAMNASAIVAQPTTITGSIGVYAGKMVTTKLWEQLGVNFETIAVDDADVSFWSTDTPYSAAAQARLDGVVDGIYRSIVARVAAGRRKPVEDIEPVARGRIWTGADARERGLVDELGGWPVALRLVREKLGLPAAAPLRVRDFPPARPPLRALLAALAGETGDSSDEPGEALGLYAATRRPQIPGSAADVAAWRAAVLADPTLRAGRAVLLTPALQVTP